MEKLGRYELREKIGRGGMADVYKGFDPRFRREVAVKVLPPELMRDSKFFQRFEREATTIASLEHHSIVPVYDFGEVDNRPFLVMRYMGHGSLEDKLKKGQISIKDALEVTKRIGSALDYAHKRSVVHRDVKPANILYGEDGVPYLSDFGIVWLTEGSVEFSRDRFLGTPHYMAPESADDDGITPLLDIYALGVTLYEMLAGELPFNSVRPSAILMAHVIKPIPNVLEVRTDLHEDVQNVIERAMAKERHDRYPFAKLIGEELERALGKSSLDTVNELVNERADRIDKTVTVVQQTKTTTDPYSNKTPIKQSLIQKYKTFGPDAEVRGPALMSFTNSIQSSSFLPLLKQFGLADHDPMMWYPQQRLCDMFSLIEQFVLGSELFHFIDIGMAVVNSVELPEPFASMPFPDINLAWGTIYKVHHRGADVGHVRVELVEPYHLRIEAMTPYPHNCNYGIHYGIAKRFLPDSTKFTVQFDQSIKDVFAADAPTILHTRWLPNSPTSTGY